MISAAEGYPLLTMKRSMRSDGALKITDQRFAAWLAGARADRKMTYEALADRVGIHTTYAQKLERGVRPAPKRDVVEALARALTPDGATPEQEHALLRDALEAAGLAPPPAPEPENLPDLPERVNELPVVLQQALRYILGLDGEVRDYMMKLWTEQARPHLEMKAELDRRREMARREMEALGAASGDVVKAADKR